MSTCRISICFVWNWTLSLYFSPFSSSFPVPLFPSFDEDVLPWYLGYISPLPLLFLASRCSGWDIEDCGVLGSGGVVFSRRFFCPIRWMTWTPFGATHSTHFLHTFISYVVAVLFLFFTFETIEKIFRGMSYKTEIL